MTATVHHHISAIVHPIYPLVCRCDDDWSQDRHDFVSDLYCDASWLQYLEQNNL